jgi:hypothetical protein
VRVVFLTSCEEGQGDDCPEFGFEALEEWCDREDVEDHVDEVEVRQREEIETVHCAR